MYSYRKTSRSCCPGSIITNNGNPPPATCSLQPQGFFFFCPIISPISPASFLWLSLSHEICGLLWIIRHQSFQMGICWINEWIGYFLVTFFLNFFLRFIRLGFPDTLEWVTLCDDLDRLPIWQDLESSWESRRCTVRKSACSATTKNWVWIHRTHVK